jgi:hypothetical protein
MYKRSFGKPIFDPMFDLIQSDSIRHAENSNPFYGARSEALEVEILTMAGQINPHNIDFSRCCSSSTSTVVGMGMMMAREKTRVARAMTRVANPENEAFVVTDRRVRHR